MCLVNDAVYIARYKNEDGSPGEWTATGAQFQVPYVFKKLFSKETILFDDMCETKSVSTALYLDMNEKLPDVSLWDDLRSIRDKLKDKQSDQWTKNEEKIYTTYKDISDEELDKRISEGHSYHFIGKVGRFCPIKEGCGGGELVREGIDKNGKIKYSSATGAKGYRWLESEMVKELNKEDDIDQNYYRAMVDAAVETISQYGDFEEFIN